MLIWAVWAIWADLVIYSNENDLKNYGFIGAYENKGQVELYVKEGEKL